VLMGEREGRKGSEEELLKISRAVYKGRKKKRWELERGIVVRKRRVLIGEHRKGRAPYYIRAKKRKKGNT